MIEPHDIEHRCDEIRDLIAGNDVLSALKKLMDFVRDFSNDRGHLDEATVISMDFRQIEAARRREELDFEAANVSRKKLVFKMLGLMHAIVDDVSLETVDA